MNDCQLDIHNKLKKEIQDNIKGRSTKIVQILSNGNGIVKFNSNFKFSQNREMSFRIAQDKVNKINELYNSDTYGEVVSLNNSFSDGIVINLHIPLNLINSRIVDNKEYYNLVPKKVYTDEANQYFANGEVYPTYEDALNSFDRQYASLAKASTIITEQSLSNISSLEGINNEQVNLIQDQLSKYENPILLFKSNNGYSSEYNNENSDIVIIDKANLQIANKDKDSVEDILITPNNVIVKNENLPIKIGNIVDGELLLVDKEQEENTPDNLYSKLLDYSKKINPNFKVQVLDNLVKKTGAIGLAQINDFTIKLQKGYEISELPEEISHFYFELLPKDSSLRKDMLGQITNYQIYKNTLESYRNSDLYKKDGKLDLNKIKSEAIAKLISEYIKAIDTQDFSRIETLTKQTGNFIQQWWNNFLNWIHQRTINTFQQSANDILLGSVEDLDLQKQVGDSFASLAFDDLNKYISEVETLNRSKLSKNIVDFHKILYKQFSKVINDEKLKGLDAVLTDPKTGISKLDPSLTLIRDARNNLETIDNTKQSITSFLNALNGMKILSEGINTRMSNLDSNISNLNEITNYQSFSQAWINYLTDLKDDLATTKLPSNELEKLVDTILGNFNTAKVKIINQYGGELSNLYSNVLNNITSAQRNDLERQIQEATTKNLPNKVNSLQKQLDNISFTQEDISNMLKGELAIKKWHTIQFWVDAAVANGDPIIATASKFIKDAGYKAEYEAGEKIKQYEKAISSEKQQLLDKYKLDIVGIGKAISFKDKVASYEKGNLVEKERYSLLSPFANYRYSKTKIKKDLEDLRKVAIQTNDWTEYKKLKESYNKENEDYYNRPYVREYYDSKKKFQENPIFEKADALRKEFYNQLNILKQSIAHNIDNESVQKEIDQVSFQLRKLNSLIDLEGKEKTGEDLEIAKILKEYSESQRKFIEVDNLQTNRSYKKAEQLELSRLNTLGLDEKSLEFLSWKDKNSMIKILPEFYTDRQGIIDKIDNILSKIERTDDSKEIWNNLFALLDGTRDSNNQYNTELLTEEQLAKVKELQLKLEELKKTALNNSGLTKVQQNNFNKINTRISKLSNKAKTIKLTVEEQEERSNLYERKSFYTDIISTKGLDFFDRKKLSKYYEALAALQSRIPTNYYWDQIENFVLDLKEGYEDYNFEQILSTKDYLTLDKFIQSDKAIQLRKENNNFDEWFEKTHIEQEFYNKQTGDTQTRWVRLHPYNIIQPNNANHYQIVPSYKYAQFRVKDAFRTKHIVGKTIDNTGEFLPLTLKDGAKDDRYQNKEYQRLINSKDTKDQLLKSFLEKTSNFYLNQQEDLQNNDKFYLDLPRIYLTNLEDTKKKLTKEYHKQNIKEKLNSKETVLGKILAVTGLTYTKEEEEIEGKGSTIDLTANTNENVTGLNDVVFGMKRDIAPENQSLNIGTLMSKFTFAAEQNIAKRNIFPIINATKDYLEAMSDRTQRKTGKQEKRSQFINAMIEREFKSKIPDVLMNSQGVRKIVNGMKKIGALKIMMDPLGGIANYGTAFIQTMVEGAAGQNFKIQDYTWAEKTFNKDIMTALYKDRSKIGDKNLWTELYETFDFVQGEFQNELGERFSLKNKWLNIGKIVMTPRTLGEVKIQSISSIMMLRNTKLLNSIDGKTYNYLDAINFEHGEIKMKDGFDKSYAPGGQSFIDLKGKIHAVNKQLHGNYAKADQSEISRYTFGQMFEFMKRFLVSASLKRYQANGFNYSTQQYEEGYYRSGAKTFRKLILSSVTYFNRKYGNMDQDKFLTTWNTMTDQDKQNFKRFVAEMSGLLALWAIAVYGMGYSGPDKDKKLQDNTLAGNYFLYSVLKLQSENTQYIPVPGLGLDDYARNINGLQMFTGVISDALTVSKLMLLHIGDLIGIDDYESDLYYSKDQGTYLRHEGDSKLLLKSLQLFGYSGKNIDPKFAIKQLEAAQRRTR